MNEILSFILQHCSFLWSDGRYRFTDSGAAQSFGGDAYVVISSDRLRMRFVRDRGQIFLDLQEVGAGEKGEWFSLDLVRRLLTDQRQDSAVMNDDYVRFFRESLAEIESRFADKSRLADTKKHLHELKRIRAKELFG